MQRVREGAACTRKSDDVKRRLLLVAVFLLAGAVVNVAVAWGCVWLFISDEWIRRTQDECRSAFQPLRSAVDW